MREVSRWYHYVYAVIIIVLVTIIEMTLALAELIWDKLKELVGKCKCQR